MWIDVTVHDGDPVVVEPRNTRGDSPRFTLRAGNLEIVLSREKAAELRDTITAAIGGEDR